jgi:hypothetical protein
VTDTDPVEINGKRWVYDPCSGSHVPEGTAAAGDRPAGQAADVELSAGSKPVATREGAAFAARVDIAVVSYRSRLADADGVSAKAAIDGLVMCGILADDTTKEIREIRYRQVKVKNVSEEKTEIIITEVTQ